MNTAVSRNTAIVKETARSLGFDFCGISKAEFLEEEAPRLEAWLKKGHHGEMQYMENHFDKRLESYKACSRGKIGDFAALQLFSRARDF